MHTHLFKPVATKLRRHLDETPWKTPDLPYIPNVLGEVLQKPDSSSIASMLERHVFSPVQWRASIDTICSDYSDVCFIEVGPGTVLFNLLQRSWRKNQKFKTDVSENLDKHLFTLTTKISNAA